MRGKHACVSLLLLLMLFLPVMIFAQGECPQWPAPCPHETEIATAQDVSQRQSEKFILPQEAAMEARVRNALTDAMQKLAKQKHWQLYELNEMGFDRPNTGIGYNEWERTPYEKRPPHTYLISFILVVNRDSLDTWRNWFKNDFAKMANDYVAQMNSNADAGTGNATASKMQAYADSAAYYNKLSADYAVQHQADYMSAIQSGNKKGQQNYTDHINRYTAQADKFNKKIQQVQTGGDNTQQDSYSSLTNVKLTQTERFANATLLLVHFSINRDIMGYGVTDADQHNVRPQHILPVAGAVYAGLLKNPAKTEEHAFEVGTADFTYYHPSWVATAFFGAWSPTHDAYGYRPAAYSANKGNTDLVSLKKVKCDAVQNLAMQIEGRPDYIKQFLSAADIGAIQKLLTAN